MGMNQTPASERVHISFFGKRNAGKSSVINAITGQDLAIVSSVRGTTTDPVYKTMELLPLGPVMIIDTPGIDDEGELGALRVRKSYQVLNKTDIAILVVDSTTGKGEEELALLHRFHEKGIPYLVVYNKIDLLSDEEIKDLAMSVRPGEVLVSAADGMNIQELKEKIATLKPEDTHKYPLIQDLIMAAGNAIFHFAFIQHTATAVNNHFIGRNIVRKFRAGSKFKHRFLSCVVSNPVRNLAGSDVSALAMVCTAFCN